MYLPQFPGIPTEAVDNFVDYRLKTGTRPIEPGLAGNRVSCHRFVIAHIFQQLMERFSKFLGGLTEQHGVVSRESSLCITAKYGFLWLCCKAT